MKNIFIKSVLALGMVASMAACNENSWNNQLEGFKDFENQPITDKQSVEYTLSEADYKAIASNATNKALADEIFSKLVEENNGDSTVAKQFKKEFAAIGTTFKFTSLATAKDFVPAYLASTSFPYFTLTTNSAVKLTYNETVNTPAEYTEAAASFQTFAIDSEMYQGDVWESDENYINGFCYSKKPENYIAKILKNAEVNPAAGKYCIVNYDYATQEPVFGGAAEKPAFEMSKVISSIKVGDTGVEILGVISGVSTQGYTVSDASGTVFVYIKGFDTTTVALGQQVKLTGDVSSFNMGFQMTNVTLEVKGTQAVSYPAPKKLTAADLDAIGANTEVKTAQYVTLTAKAAISTYYNLIVDGTAVQGSVYGATQTVKDAFKNDETVTVTGWLVSVSGTSTKYANIIVTNVNGKAITPVRKKVASRSVPEVPMVNENMVYMYDGAKWVKANNFLALNTEDYIAMGGSKTGIANAEPYLSMFLNGKYPYAAAGTNMFVFWLKGGKYALAAYQTAAMGQWTADKFQKANTSQFVNIQTAEGVNKWIYDPNVTIILPNGKSQPLTTQYFQWIADWVKAGGNAQFPIENGALYVSKYGNNEYWCGTSAYYGNVDLRPSYASTQYPEGWAGKTDEQIVGIEKYRFFNIALLVALENFNPDADLVPGMDVFYTVEFPAYYGTETKTETAVYKLIGKGKFQPVSCTWGNYDAEGNLVK